MVKLECPILTDFELAKIREISIGNFRAVTLPMTFPVSQGEAGLEASLKSLCQQASEAVAGGASILILSDRGAGADQAPMPSLLATSAVHHHLIREGTRTKAGLVVESGEAREVMHFALLIGYGAGAINPYLAFETMADMVRQNLFSGEVTVEKAYKNYVKSINKALLKIIAKMGISTIQSYRGAQIFEAIGLNTATCGAVLHRNTLPCRRHWDRDSRSRMSVTPPQGVSRRADQQSVAGCGWAISMAARRRVSPLQSGDSGQAAGGCSAG